MQMRDRISDFRNETVCQFKSSPYKVWSGAIFEHCVGWGGFLRPIGYQGPASQSKISARKAELSAAANFSTFWGEVDSFTVCKQAEKKTEI